MRIRTERRQAIKNRETRPALKRRRRRSRWQDRAEPWHYRTIERGSTSAGSLKGFHPPCGRTPAVCG